MIIGVFYISCFSRYYDHLTPRAMTPYRVALFCVTGQDIELEGNALSRLARFYSKIAKLPVPYVIHIASTKSFT
jgi:hypothetical protein